MSNPTEITIEILYAFVDKYIDKFIKRFPELIMRVYFTPNGQPPAPPELCDDTPEIVSGQFVKVRNEYRIGINNQLVLPGQLLAFFHEYGHAVHRREANKEIDDESSLIRTETAALLSSLKLADEEGLPNIARLAIESARILRHKGRVYHEAMTNLKDHPLWKKYADTN